MARSGSSTSAAARNVRAIGSIPLISTPSNPHALRSVARVRLSHRKIQTVLLVQLPNRTSSVLRLYALHVSQGSRAVRSGRAREEKGGDQGASAVAHVACSGRRRRTA